MTTTTTELQRKRWVACTKAFFEDLIGPLAISWTIGGEKVDDADEEIIVSLSPDAGVVLGPQLVAITVRDVLARWSRTSSSPPR